MSATNWKHWLLQHERAVLALQKNPLRLAARLHRVPAEQIEEFCQEHGLKHESVTAADVQAVKVKLGILATSPAPAKPAAPERPAEVAPEKPAPAAAPKPAPAQSSPVADDGASPWKQYPRGPQAAKVERYRADLAKLADGSWSQYPVTGALGSFLMRWLGTTRPAPEKVQRFLSWLDRQPSDPEPEVSAAAKRVAPPVKSVVSPVERAPRRKSGRTARPAAKKRVESVPPPSKRMVELDRLSSAGRSTRYIKDGLRNIIAAARKEIARQEAIIVDAEQLIDAFDKLTATLKSRLSA